MCSVLHDLVSSVLQCAMCVLLASVICVMNMSSMIFMTMFGTFVIMSSGII